MWGKFNHSSQFHWTYILRDRLNPGRFKIGYTNQAPEDRALQEDYRIYKAIGELPRAIEVCKFWPFLSPHSAFYIEQAPQTMLRKAGFHEVDKNNWVEMDDADLMFFLSIINPL
jgi:hypothetical protein